MLRATVTEIVCGIADSIFGFEIEPCGADLANHRPQLTVRIEVSGAWCGLIGLEVAAGLARRATVAMFQLERDPREDEILDALGEVVNIIGGNLKALLPGPSRLSLPRVETTPVEAWLDSASERVSFSSGGELLTVVVRPNAPSSPPPETLLS